MMIGVGLLCVCRYLTNVPLVREVVSQINMDSEWSLKEMEQWREFYVGDCFLTHV